MPSLPQENADLNSTILERERGMLIVPLESRGIGSRIGVLLRARYSLPDVQEIITGVQIGFCPSSVHHSDYTGGYGSFVGDKKESISVHIKACPCRKKAI
jgi:hypothetical protein